MTDITPTPIAGQLIRPEPVDGKIENVDIGFPGTVILTVVKNGARYYETYELVTVETEEEVLSAAHDSVDARD